MDPQVRSDLRDRPAHPEYGVRADELVALSTERGVPLQGVQASVSEELPVPFVAHYRFGHFVTVTERGSDGSLRVYDPILNHAVVMDTEAFSAGVVGTGVGTRRGLGYGWSPLGTEALRAYSGGCCGVELTNSEEGGQGPQVGGTEDECGFGLCTWSFSPLSMNVYLRDTPLWYQPALGPGVAFTMSYNSIDADQALPSFGPKWFFSYHSYAVETPAAGGCGHGDGVHARRGQRDLLAARRRKRVTTRPHGCSTNCASWERTATSWNFPTGVDSITVSPMELRTSSRRC